MGQGKGDYLLKARDSLRDVGKRTSGDRRRGRHSGEGPGSHVLARFSAGAWGNHVWVPRLSDSPTNSGLEMFFLACISVCDLPP